MKPNINSVKVRPYLSNNRRPVDGELVHDSLLWPLRLTLQKLQICCGLVGIKLLNGVLHSTHPMQQASSKWISRPLSGVDALIHAWHVVPTF
jgi:hypothetical protein